MCIYAYVYVYMYINPALKSGSDYMLHVIFQKETNKYFSSLSKISIFFKKIYLAFIIAFLQNKFCHNYSEVFLLIVF